MANPLVETKLYLPRLRRSLVARPRLSGRLLRGSDARLTLISAPAGFGKTTLLTAWLAAAATDDRSVAWLSLDHGDRQPATFWTYVITALQTAVPGIGADVLPDTDNNAKNLGVMNIAGALPSSIAPAIAPVILAISSGSYGVLYAVAGICAIIGGAAILPVKRVR